MAHRCSGSGRRRHVSTEENKALARRVLEEMFNKGNLDAADELLAPDYVDHDPAMPEDVHGPEGFKEYVGAYRSAFSALHLEIGGPSRGGGAGPGRVQGICRRVPLGVF